jgi:hypothetical protein
LKRKANEVIAEGDLKTVVDYAIDLNRDKVWLDAQLEEVKIYLRAEARLKDASSFAVDLDGNLGTVTVTFPGVSMKTKKGKDLRDMEENLPEEVFAEFFNRSVLVVPSMPADDFLDAMAKLPQTVQLKINTFLAFEDQTPRVSLPK